MNILFVSGVDVGGAPRSTCELAEVLASRGHEVVVILGKSSSMSGLYGLLVRVTIKLERGLGVSLGRLLIRPLGGAARASTRSTPNVKVLDAKFPENVLASAIKDLRPHVVVANSFPREQMKWVSHETRAANVPFAIYLREEHALSHFTHSKLSPDLVLANSKHLQARAASIGMDSIFAPSVVDLQSSAVESTRQAMVMVNPIAENRPEILRRLAHIRPDILCVLQESWPLDPGELQELTGWASELPNLEVRPRTSSPKDVYRDARFLLATYPTNRPRVVLEAQANGIPVIALDQPALAEMIDAPELVFPASLTDDEWAQRLSSLWDEGPRYREWARTARLHSARVEVTPGSVAEVVTGALGRVVR